MNRVGEAPGSFYGYRIVKLFREEDCDETGKAINQPYWVIAGGNILYAQPSARAGDYQFADLNGDAVIDERDMTFLGSPQPELNIGAWQSLEFGNYDLSFSIVGSYGNEIFNLTRFWTYHPYGFSNWSTDIKNAYRSPEYDSEGVLIDPGNTDTDLHRVDDKNTNKNLRVSDFYVEDGSFLRLKTVQLGYTLPQSLTARIYIQKFRIYFAARNLFTHTAYSGLDPEVGGWGIDAGIYPQPRTYLFGINMEF